MFNSGSMNKLMICLTLYFLILSVKAESSLKNTSSEFSQREFVENKGQYKYSDQYMVEDEVLYVAEAGGFILYIRKSGMSFVFTSPQNPDNGSSLPVNPLKNNQSRCRIDLDIVNISENAIVNASVPYKHVYNYFLPTCPKGICGVKTFGKITYSNIYPGIDMMVYFNEQNEAEYDFIIKPGAKPSDIKLKFSHHNQCIINQEGGLTISCLLGSFTKSKPKSYQNLGQKNLMVESSFQINGNELSFHTGAYNGLETLIIDPVIRLWGTYSGGILNDFCRKITSDFKGNIYTCGETSSNFFLCSGGYQPLYGGGCFDAFIAKYSPGGSLEWKTFYGGSAEDYCRDIMVDSMGEIYITGTTNSNNLVDTCAYQAILNTGGCAGTDAYIAKFNNNGNVKIWDTYYGGSNDDYANAICAGQNGNIIIAGNSLSPDVMGTGGMQSVIGSSQWGETWDGFMVVFSNSGNRLWGSYFGGNGQDNVYDIAACDDAFVIAGSTRSSNLNVMNAFQPLPDIGTDGFIAKISYGGSLLFCTYYGGNADDFITGIDIDLNNNIVVAGHSNSTNQIGNGGLQPLKSTGGYYGYDGFIAKFNPAGSRLWGSYTGGNGDEQNLSITINSNNEIVIAGETESSINIAYDAFQPDKNLLTDIFTAAYTNGGSRLWATYYGGNSQETSGSVHTTDNKIYICGATQSSSVIGENGYQPQAGGYSDGFLAAFDYCSMGITYNSSQTNILCKGQNILMDLNISEQFPFQNGNQFLIQLSDKWGSFENPVLLAATTQLTGQYNINIPLQTETGYHYRIRLQSTHPELTGPDNGSDLIIENCSGISQVEAEYVRVYPNCGNGIIYVDMPFIQIDNCSLSLTDSYGQLIYAEKINTGMKNRVDLGRLSAGMYYWHVSAGDRHYNGKIMIVH